MRNSGQKKKKKRQHNWAAIRRQRGSDVVGVGKDTGAGDVIGTAIITQWIVDGLNEIHVHICILPGVHLIEIGGKKF